MRELSDVEKKLYGGLEGDEIEFVRKTVEHHKPCWGRGFVGWRVDKTLVVCSCVERAWIKVVSERAKRMLRDKERSAGYVREGRSADGAGMYANNVQGENSSVSSGNRGCIP